MCTYPSYLFSGVDTYVVLICFRVSVNGLQLMNIHISNVWVHIWLHGTFSPQLLYKQLCSLGMFVELNFLSLWPVIFTSR